MSKPKILAYISSKDRYDILFMAMQSIALQTRKPDKFILFDDGEHKDLRKVDVYGQMFRLFDQNGIKWEVLFGEGKGQHFNHQRANSMGDEFDLLWRLDDDEYAEPDVLEKLLSVFESNVNRSDLRIAAVAGAVITPGGEAPGGTNKIEDIFHTPNMQWARGQTSYDVDHLYSSFLYIPGIVDYDLTLSPVGHREETSFTYSMKMKGYNLVVIGDAVTYHYRKESGGIRSHDQRWFYEHDDAIFLKKLENWGYKFCCLNSGLGDHLAFSAKALPNLLQRHKNVVLGCCYPEVFEDFKVKTIPVGPLMHLPLNDNVYKWMIDNRWKKSIVEAYCRMYGVSK